jgi:hypothetical protein
MSAINPRLLPESFRRCMAPEVRKEMETPTFAEASEKAARGEELKMHRVFEDWCRLNGIIVIHSRTDRKPTIAPGHPDFTLLKGGHGELSPDQVEKVDELQKAHVPVLVTKDLATAIAFARLRLGLCGF